jgi:hypothetical protein
MHPRTPCARLHESPELTARRKECAAGATYHAAIVFSRVEIDDGRRTAVGARKFFRHSAFPLLLIVLPIRSELNNGELELLFRWSPLLLPSSAPCRAFQVATPIFNWVLSQMLLLRALERRVTHINPGGHSLRGGRLGRGRQIDIPPVRLDAPKQQKNDNDDQNDADNTNAPVTVAVSVTAKAPTEAAKQENDQDDNEDCAERHGVISLAAANERWAFL